MKHVVLLLVDFFGSENIRLNVFMHACVTNRQSITLKSQAIHIFFQRIDKQHLKA